MTHNVYLSANFIPQFPGSDVVIGIVDVGEFWLVVGADVVVVVVPPVYSPGQ